MQCPGDEAKTNSVNIGLGIFRSPVHQVGRLKENFGTVRELRRARERERERGKERERDVECF